MTKQKTILLIEDDIFTSDLYKRQLEKAGYLVDVTPNGVAALEITRESTPDLLLLDIMLPKMDGFEFLHRLRQQHPDQYIPIIILSNLDRESIMKEGFNLGAKGYIVKSSTTPDKVVLEVEKILKADTP